MARFTNLVIALNIKDHYTGEDVNEIFETLPDTEAAQGEDPLKKVIDALTAYFTPKKNVAYEEYQFRQAIEDQGETVMAYYTRLKRLA